MLRPSERSAAPAGSTLGRAPSATAECCGAGGARRDLLSQVQESTEPLHFGRTQREKGVGSAHLGSSRLISHRAGAPHPKEACPFPTSEIARPPGLSRTHAAVAAPIACVSGDLGSSRVISGNLVRRPLASLG